MGTKIVLEFEDKSDTQPTSVYTKLSNTQKLKIGLKSYTSQSEVDTSKISFTTAY